jgi:methionyl-tRNA formyltransferase
MRILFMGTPQYAVAILQALASQSDIEIVALFTQPDKPVGRKQTLQAPPVKVWAKANFLEVPIFQPPNLKSDEIVGKIASLKPDFIIVAAFGQLLPQSVLNIAPCINLHASLLPLYRGASPIQYALLENQKYTGVSAMLMDAGLDTGKMLGFSVVPIKEDEDAKALFEKLAKKAAKLTIKTLRLWPKLAPINQYNALSSYAPKITKKDGLVSFEWTKLKIFKHYLALTPWPGIYLESGLKLLEIDLSDSGKKNRPGEILKIDENGAVVACANGAIIVKRVQAPSKKPLHVKDYLQGQRRKVGDLLF